MIKITTLVPRTWPLIAMTSRYEMGSADSECPLRAKRALQGVWLAGFAILVRGLAELKDAGEASRFARYGGPRAVLMELKAISGGVGAAEEIEAAVSGFRRAARSFHPCDLAAAPRGAGLRNASPGDLDNQPLRGRQHRYGCGDVARLVHINPHGAGRACRAAGIN